MAGALRWDVALGLVLLASMCAQSGSHRTPAAAAGLAVGVLGNWGGTSVPPYTTPGQLAVAASLEAVAQATNMALLLSTGGNFLPNGLPAGGTDSAATQLRYSATFAEVYSGPALASVPFYLVGSYADWLGNITAERGFTEGPTGRWQYSGLWQTFTLTVPGGDVTVQFVLVDTVTLTGDMVNNPRPAPPGTATPPPPAGGATTDSSDDTSGASAQQAQAGPPPASGRRRRLAERRLTRGSSRRLQDFNSKHHPPVSSAQWEWFGHVVNASVADWLIVVGADPIYSAGEHGPTWGLVEAMLPILEQHGAALYVSGRDQLLQHFRIGNGTGVDFVASGVGAVFNATMSAELPSLALCPPGSLAYSYGNGTGFATLQFTGKATGSAPSGWVTVSFYDAAGSVLYSFRKVNSRLPRVYGTEQSVGGVTRGGEVLEAALLGVLSCGFVYFAYLSFKARRPAPTPQLRTRAPPGSLSHRPAERVPLLGAKQQRMLVPVDL